jgi:hypothetical protein
MNEQYSRPLFIIAILPPIRLDYKSVHLLPFRPFEVKVLWRTQRFSRQCFLGKPGNLFRRDFPLGVALSVNQVRFKLVEATNDEYVIWSLE